MWYFEQRFRISYGRIEWSESLQLTTTRGLRGKRGALAIGGGNVRLLVSYNDYYNHHHAISVYRVLWLQIICICLVATINAPREILRAGTGTASVHLGGHSTISDCRYSISRITSGKAERGLGRVKVEDCPERRSWNPWLGPVLVMSGCIL